MEKKTHKHQRIRVTDVVTDLVWGVSAVLLKCARLIFLSSERMKIKSHKGQVHDPAVFTYGFPLQNPAAVVLQGVV